MVRGHRQTLPHTVQFYDADIDEDGILILDLRPAKVSLRSIGHARNRNKNHSA